MRAERPLAVRAGWSVCGSLVKSCMELSQSFRTAFTRTAHGGTRTSKPSPITRSTAMPNIGPMELVIVLVVALLILGPKRLPGAGRSLGRGMREFKDSVTGQEKAVDQPVED